MNATPKYTRNVAISMVVANMIGTGVFTSLGYQVLSLPSAPVILLLWIIGGIIALCGALAYAEVSSVIKGSGGEYNYLSKIYHPSLGFVSGWMSLIAGFSAPICVVAFAIGRYFSPVIGVESTQEIAIASILIFTVVHLLGVHAGGQVQKLLTVFKVALIVVFCIVPFFADSYEPSGTSFSVAEAPWEMVFSSGFVVSLAFIMYAYSGWNASTYIAGVLDKPQKNLPYSLIVGTLIVTVLYVAINAVFLYVGTFEELSVKPPEFNEVDVGNVVAFKLFGAGIGAIFASLITLALASSLSAMIMAGPRVTEQIGQDYPLFRALSVKSKGGSPYLATLLQAAIAIVMVLTSSFEWIINYIAIALSVFSTLTVLGVFVLRVRRPEAPRSFRTWGYPVTPLLFVVANTWFLYYMVKEKPETILFSIGTMGIGLLVYFVAAWWWKKK